MIHVLNSNNLYKPLGNFTKYLLLCPKCHKHQGFVPRVELYTFYFYFLLNYPFKAFLFVSSDKVMLVATDSITQRPAVELLFTWKIFLYEVRVTTVTENTVEGILGEEQRTRTTRSQSGESYTAGLPACVFLSYFLLLLTKNHALCKRLNSHVCTKPYCP